MLEISSERSQERSLDGLEDENVDQMYGRRHYSREDEVQEDFSRGQKTMLHSLEATRQGLTPYDDDYDELDQLGQILKDANKKHMEASQSMTVPSNLVYPHAEERKDEDNIFRPIRRTEKFKAQCRAFTDSKMIDDPF